MISYFVGILNSTIFIDPGDTFNLLITDGKTGEQELVCSQKIICSEVISHYAYVNLPGVGVAYFIGNEKLAGVLAERFPDAKILDLTEEVQ